MIHLFKVSNVNLINCRCQKASLPESRGYTPTAPSYAPWVAGPQRPAWHRRMLRRVTAGRRRRANCSGGCSNADKISATPSLRFSDPPGCRWYPLTWGDLAVRRRFAAVATATAAAATSSSFLLLFLHTATTFYDDEATRSCSYCCSFYYSPSCCSAPHRPRIIVPVLLVICHRMIVTWRRCHTSHLNLIVLNFNRTRL